MRELDLLGAAAAFGMRAAAMELVLQRGLERVMAGIERTAAASIGRYQPAAGDFVAWAPLAEATLTRKSARGFATPKPLLETGEMLASFSHETNGLEGIAGATDFKMAFHETGTQNMPPRPVWGPAGYNNRENIQRLLGAAVVAGITGDADRLADDGGGYRYQIRV